MTNEVPISDVVISAVPPPSAPAPAPAPAPASAAAPHSTKRKLDAMGETEGNSMEPAKQLPRSESSTVQVNPNELHSIPLNNDNKPIISGMAPVPDTSASAATTGGDAVINITDDGTEGQPETQPAASGVADKILFGFDRVLDAAQYPVDQIKSAGQFVGEGVVKVAEEVVDTVKDGLAVAGLGATVVKDALVEVAVQTNLALQENFGKAVAAGELAAEKAEEKIVHLTEVVTGHPTPNPVPSTSTTQPGAPTETANLANTNTTLQPDQGIAGAPATTVKPGLSTSSTFTQQHDAASQWHAEAEKHQNVV